MADWIALSLVAHVVLDHVDALVEADSVLLDHNLLLYQRVHLLLQEVTLVDVINLQLLEVFLQVSDVLNDLFQDVICCFSGMVLQCCTLWPQQLDFLFVVIEQLACVFWASLWHTNEIERVNYGGCYARSQAGFEWKVTDLHQLR